MLRVPSRFLPPLEFLCLYLLDAVMEEAKLPRVSLQHLRRTNGAAKEPLGFVQILEELFLESCLYCVHADAS